ncbi:hypothetical protein ARMSODRAFT_899170 [Armillaria solidipes]|uniref:CID domain-containing protein n=1 Tax=Armillaria solidipes TaxID=1076256 RepID=A0A2H3B4H3_9AGAR|nr:hypothetical protein ARMSODRAFT_899170 [Armillaria solidipes]
MSLYQQGYYAQPANSAPAFSPPVAGYSGPVAYPSTLLSLSPPIHHHDPASFRKEFTNCLAELSFNSRPIIQGLATIARDHTRFADVVVECIENHIRGAPPWTKLPAFYLLDMISKNIYNPYARLFATFVAPLFLRTYGEVDALTRSKMEELVLTWRTGSPSGTELFSLSLQASIECGMWGGSTRTKIQSTSFRGSNQATTSQVLSELEFNPCQKERAQQANAHDPVNQQYIQEVGFLSLLKLVETSTSQQDVHQILGQLRVSSQSTSPPRSLVTQRPVQIGLIQSYPPLTAPPGPADVISAFPSFDIAVPKSTHVAHTNVAPATYADLLSSLVKAGVISSTDTPLRAEEDRAESDDAQCQIERSYRDSVLAFDIQLSTSGITKTHLPIHDLLYSKLPLQCKQCGIRFSDTHTGKESMQEHLDMHFSQNRKANQNLGQGCSRSWFVAMEDWIHDINDIKGKGCDATRHLNPRAAAAAEKIQREAELQQLFVVVPLGHESELISCPICKESLISEFLEDDEEWVWKNALTEDGRVYYATCHAETLTSNSLAVRLRAELAAQLHNRSWTLEARARLSTPLAPSMAKMSPSPTPWSKPSGSKRKFDDTLSMAGNTRPQLQRSPPPRRLVPHR